MDERSAGIRYAASVFGVALIIVASLPQGETLPFHPIRVGWYGPSEKAFFVIQDGEQWERLWNLTFECRYWHPAFECPSYDFVSNVSHEPPYPVDFSNASVIAVFWGPKPHGGYAVEIGSVERLPSGDVIVHVYETHPSPFGVYPQMVEFPKRVVITERMDGAVAFVEHAV